MEPVYTLDADVVMLASALANFSAQLEAQGFKIEEHPYSVKAPAPESKLRIQFTTDERYQAFLARSVDAEGLGIRAKVACLEDVVQGKLWAYSDSCRRLSKRKKDELDLIRLAEACPALTSTYPEELREQIERG